MGKEKNTEKASDATSMPRIKIKSRVQISFKFKLYLRHDRFFFLFSFFFNFYSFRLLVISSCSRSYFYFTSSYTTIMTYLAISKSCDDEQVDDNGNRTRGKACENGWYPCDTRRKFRPSGISDWRHWHCSATGSAASEAQ